ncbi:hypothetical protein M011DRAFT_458708 [Sporormia fimetaria CBS 119925]|uniref:Uncharacterized protein n=1 Tax=Sporormia fimetaria CBS 119925 TaxID=1340428 RepID=A0A6A6VBE3_9PLEO|nr:hypothetical protein M011DRAFT_458708 [Sporormia fimetaria CBS 119925]
MQSKLYSIPSVTNNREQAGTLAHDPFSLPLNGRPWSAKYILLWRTSLPRMDRPPGPYLPTITGVQQFPYECRRLASIFKMYEYLLLRDDENWVKEVGDFIVQQRQFDLEKRLPLEKTLDPHDDMFNHAEVLQGDPVRAAVISGIVYYLVELMNTDMIKLKPSTGVIHKLPVWVSSRKYKLPVRFDVPDRAGKNPNPENFWPIFMMYNVFVQKVDVPIGISKTGAFFTDERYAWANLRRDQVDMSALRDHGK